MSQSKYCSHCKGTDGPFRETWKYVKKDGTERRLYLCRPCNTDRMRELKRRKGPAYVREINRKTYEKHKEKWIARAKARYAIKTGKLVRPDRCEVCELKKPPQGHHEDYSKPLEVIWLCSGCHADAHKEMGTGYGRTKETTN